MPFTPFHVGPGAALHAVAPRHVSFLAFCVVTVLIDFETLDNLRTNTWPVHGFFHTYVGASVVVLLTLVLFLTARRVRSVLPDLFQWKELTVAQVATGAAAGGYSHVLLDGVMHPDVAPFAPWSYENGLLGVVSLETVHWFCVAAGAAALVILGARRFARQAVR